MARGPQHAISPQIHVSVGLVAVESYPTVWIVGGFPAKKQ